MSQRIAVLHVVEAMDTGGAESMVVELARAAASEFRVLICALNGGGPALEAARAAGADTRVLAKGGRRAEAVARLARLMREERIQVAHGHNPSGALYATLAACWAGVPVRVRTEHSVRYPGRHSAAYPMLERLINRLNQRVVCVCDAVRESHRAVAPARKLVVVENGIGEGSPPRPREETRAALGEDPRAPVALAIGSLTRQKAHEILIEALARAREKIPDARLWIAGEGAERAELEDLARERGVAPAVRFLGRRGDVGDLLEAADLFVLPSRREGLSVTLLEALRSGRPAVVTRVGGSGDAVAHGVSGWVVPPEDAARLAEALVRLWSDAELRARLTAAGRTLWRNRYTARRMAAETENIYRELLEARRRPSKVSREVRDDRVVA